MRPANRQSDSLRSRDALARRAARSTVGETRMLYSLAPNSTNAVPVQGQSAVQAWLWIVALLVLVMVGVGGATRLTGSGLSITEWRPIMGALPPLSDTDWHDAFAKYKEIPQYHQINKGMSLAEFKSIFWWEWGHRLLGRVIGLAFALPLAWFCWRGAISGRLGRHLAGLLALGALQGGMGWYMVMSGLTERTSVSQYRLAAHLGLAILIFGLLVWTALGMTQRRKRSVTLDTMTPHLKRLARILVALVFAQILLGALVAGLKAGLTYNTWPLMDGKLVPSGLFTNSPWYANFFENITMVQFNHRIMAYFVLVVAAWHAWSVQRIADDALISASAWALLAAVIAQAAIGIWTLLAVVPLSLGIAHQTGAVIVFGISVWHLHCITRAAAL